MKDWLDKRYVIFIIFLLIGILTYWNSFGNSFHYDDEMVIVYNRNVTSLKNIPYFFINPKMMFSDLMPGGHYRPLVLTSYAVSYAFTQLNPVAYHLFNFFFHVGSAFLIFLIVKAMLGSIQQSDDAHRDKNVPPIDSRVFLTPTFVDSRGFLTPMFVASMASGLIFLVHPFNSEAVNYVTALSSVMSGFFYLLAFYCWVLFRSQKQEVRSKIGEDRQGFSNFLPLASCFYIASLLAFIAGMLSKEVVITLIVVLWLYDMYGFRSVSSKQSAVSNEQLADKTAYRSPLTADYLLNWRTYIPYIPFVLLVAVPYLLIRLFSLGKVLDHFQRDIWTQLFTELPVLVKHWQMFFIPVDLTPLHLVEIYRTYWSFPVLLSTVIITAYLIIAFILSRVQRRTLRIISFFMFWFFIVLLPTTIIPLNDIFQENRGYLAMVSFAVLAGVVIGELGRIKIKWVSMAVLVGLIIFYAGCTVQRNKVWKSEMALWTDALKKSPRSPAVYTALAVEYKRARKFNMAIDASNKAILLGGNDNFFIHDNLGRIYSMQEKYDLAIKEFEQAVKLYPYKSDTHNELGHAYFIMGKIELAEKELKEAIKYDPKFSRPYYNLGILSRRGGKSSEAINYFKTVISLNPAHSKSWFNLGSLMEEMGNKDEALRYYNRAVQVTAKDEQDVAQEAREAIDRLEKMRAAR
ncbi:MAG: tetratricopeptide repeat protein [Nitrospirae bacterium]|nr:tetratricopeptide repeat protein [Nitrospirota bacterium]